MPTCSHCSSSHTSVSPMCHIQAHKVPHWRWQCSRPSLKQDGPFSHQPFASLTDTFCPTDASYPEAKATLLWLTENWWCFVNLGTIHPLVWFWILRLVSLEAWTPVSRVTGVPMNLPPVSATNPLLYTFQGQISTLKNEVFSWWKVKVLFHITVTFLSATNKLTC